MKFLLSVLFIAQILLSACGQTGDLVLPPEYTNVESGKKAEEKPNKKSAQ